MPLREFVYLDEVSVYSLVGSLSGPIAGEYTDTDSSTLKSQSSKKFKIGKKDLAELERTDTEEGTFTVGSQVVRKSIIQTTFGDLSRQVKDHRLIRPIVASMPPVDLRTSESVMEAIDELQQDGWIIGSKLLDRGKLVEVDVILEAEETYRFNSIMSALAGIFSEGSSILAAGRERDLEQMMAIQRVLDKLLVGLIPVRGRVVDYSVVEFEGTEVIIHNKLLPQLDFDENLRRPLFIVGVTEERLYWKDVRRVLFSDSRYRVLCRLSVDGLQASWAPVKLLSLLNDIAPDFEDAIKVFVRQGNKGFKASAANSPSVAEQVRYALVEFLLELHRIAKDDSSKISLEDMDIGQGPFDSVDAIRQPFSTLIKAYETRDLPGVDIETMVSMRDRILKAHGLDFSSRESGQLSALAAAPPVSQVDSMSSNERYLDCELIAIYW